MKQVVRNLCLLQEIDDEARKFHEERGELQAKLNRLKELLDLMMAGLDEKKDKLSEANRWYKDKDAELKTDQEKVNKAKSKLQTVSKNKEFMAMQREIESLRKANVAREEEMMKLLQATDEFKKSISEEEDKIQELTKEQTAQEKANAKRVAELDREISVIDDRKSVIFKDLDKRVITTYERISKARHGVAIVPVVNSACTGCNYRVTPHQLQALYRCETIEKCRSCNRIIYVPVEDVVPVESSEDDTVENATA